MLGFSPFVGRECRYVKRSLSSPDRKNYSATTVKPWQSCKNCFPTLPVVCGKTERETDSKANPDAHPASAAGNMHNFRINIAAADKQGFAFMDTGQQFLVFVCYFLTSK